MVATEDVEEVEILKARFDTFDQELKTNTAKVEVVNQLSSQLLESEHPYSDEVLAREKQLNERSVQNSLNSYFYLLVLAESVHATLLVTLFPRSSSEGQQIINIQ